MGAGTGVSGGCVWQGGEVGSVLRMYGTESKADEWHVTCEAASLVV